MMNKIFSTISVFCAVLFFNISFSQEIEHNESNHAKESVEHEVQHEVQHEAEGHHAHPKHNIALALSHTHIKSGVDNDSGDNWRALPSFGINYTYSINEKWVIGLHSDLIIEEFIVEDPNSHGEVEYHKNSEESEVEGIERSRPLSVAIMGGYRAHEHILLLAGGGMEFSKHEDFAVVRLAVETPFHLPGNWEVFGAVSFDFNIDAYNSVTFGVGVAKLF